MPDELNISSYHSEEVQDIIGRPPSWICRRGNIVITFLVLVLLTGAWAIRYPDIVSAPARITSFNPPVKLVAQSSGRIAELRTKDDQIIEKGQIIAVVDNPAKTNDMVLLKAAVEVLDTALDINLPATIRSISLLPDMQVGDLQSDYAALYQAMINYDFFNKNRYYNQKRSSLIAQRYSSGKIRQNIEERARILNEQLKLDKWKDSVNRILLSEKIISQAEYNDMERNLMSQRLNSSSNTTSLLQNDQQGSEYQKNLTDVQQQFNIDLKNSILAIKDVAKRLKGEIANWEKLYVFQSPLKGKLVFFQVRKENQYVTAGTPVFIIVPDLEQYEVRAQLPVYKAGKIKKGQKALIKLAQYPYEEFGMLQADVASFTNVALDSSYIVDLTLENGLTTTRRRKIANMPEILGTADIVTNDKNILQRLFESVYSKVH